MHKTSGYTFRLWVTTDFRSIQKHTPHQIVLGTISLEDLRKAAETKYLLRKEKIDRQLTAQSSSMPFMSDT